MDPFLLDICSFLTKLLDLDDASNLMPIATKLGLAEEKRRHVVQESWLSNDEQLKSILHDFQQKEDPGKSITSSLKQLKQEGQYNSFTGSFTQAFAI